MQLASKNRKIGPILSLLWWCAGTTPNLLKEWPTEWSKYTSIGISVLTSALLGAVSSGYVLYTVSRSFWLAVIVGVAWSLLILNLDRLIVSTLTSSNERRSQLLIFTEQFIKALPRFILAFVIALVISTPLQMVVFQKDIQEEIYKQHSQQLENTKQQIAVTEREIANLNESLTFESKRLASVSESYIREVEGTGGTGRTGLGPESRKRLEELKLVEKEVKASKGQLEKDLVQKTSELAALKNQQDDLNRILQNAQSSFLSRYESLSKLVKADARIMLVGLSILVLIILLEVTPVLVKLLSPRGPYDEALSRNATSFKDEISQPATQLDLQLREAFGQALDNSFLKHRQENHRQENLRP